MTDTPRRRPRADDWRRQGQERYLRGVSLTYSDYFAVEPNDHDHCEFCGHKFSLVETDALRTGYTTTDRRWVCTVCFVDFRDELGWQLSS